MWFGWYNKYKRRDCVSRLLFPLWTCVFLARLQSILRTVGRIKQKLYVTVSICTVYLLVKKLATGHQRRVAQQLVEAPSRLAWYQHVFQPSNSTRHLGTPVGSSTHPQVGSIYKLHISITANSRKDMLLALLDWINCSQYVSVSLPIDLSLNSPPQW